MQFSQLLSGVAECPKIRGVGNVRELAFQISGVGFAILFAVQQTVNIMENIPFANASILMMLTEVVQRPVGDILAAVLAVFSVGIEGEALRISG